MLSAVHGQAVVKIGGCKIAIYLCIGSRIVWIDRATIRLRSNRSPTVDLKSKFLQIGKQRTVGFQNFINDFLIRFILCKGLPENMNTQINFTQTADDGSLRPDEILQ